MKHEIEVSTSRFTEPKPVAPEPVTIHIPATVEGMHIASKVQKFEKAAWVWAYTVGMENPMTPAEFARLGINQLRSAQTVHYYRQLWQDVIDQGYAKPVRPGDDILEPVDPSTGKALDWKKVGVTPDAEKASRIGGEEMAELYAAAAAEAGTTVGQAIRAGSSKAGMVAAILADPEVEKAVRTALLQKEDQRRHEPPVIRPERDMDEAQLEFNRIVMRMASVKRLAHQVLTLTMNLRGHGEVEKRAYVAELVIEAQNLFTAIGEVAEGNSTDMELEKLLSEGK